MSIEFNLPDVGEGLAEVEIVEWLVAVGQQVREDDPLVEVETDKAVVQITTPVTGRLLRQAAAPGEQVAVGALLAEFATGSEVDSPPGDTRAGHHDDRTPAAAAHADDSAPMPAVGSAGTGRPKATPATRGLARRLEVDIASVTGTGPGGRIVDSDVEAVAAGNSPGKPGARRTGTDSNDDNANGDMRSAISAQGAERSPSVGLAGTTQPLRGVRRVIAETMTQSWQTIPHVSSFHEVDMGALVALREELRLAGRAAPLTAFLVVAAARALRTHRELNASVGDGEIVHHADIDMGVAFDGDSGVIVPVIRQADTKSLWQVADELHRLAEQVELRSLAPGQLQGATFTVNNYGPLGGWFGTSLVTPPQVGILSWGPARDQVVPVDGVPGIRPIAVMNLAADHRVADGRGLIGYCTDVRDLVEHPVHLLLEA